MTRFILIDFFILLPYAGESTMLHVHNIHRMYMCYCTTGFGTRPLKDRATTVRNEAGPSWRCICRFLENCNKLQVMRSVSQKTIDTLSFWCPQMFTGTGHLLTSVNQSCIQVVWYLVPGIIHSWSIKIQQILLSDSYRKCAHSLHYLTCWLHQLILSLGWQCFWFELTYLLTSVWPQKHPCTPSAPCLSCMVFLVGWASLRS